MNISKINGFKVPGKQKKKKTNPEVGIIAYHLNKSLLFFTSEVSFYSL